jgi:hypothetical protein
MLNNKNPELTRIDAADAGNRPGAVDWTGNISVENAAFSQARAADVQAGTRDFGPSTLLPLLEKLQNENRQFSNPSSLKEDENGDGDFDDRGETRVEDSLESSAPDLP